MLPKTNKNRSSNIVPFLSLTVVLFVVAMVIAFTASGIFSALRTANEIDEALLQSVTPRINQDQLDRAFRSITTREVPALDGE